MNTLTTSRKFDTIEAAIEAGKTELSAAQNKAYQTRIFVMVDGGGNFLMDTCPAGYPVDNVGWTKVAYHNGRKWVRNEAAIEALVEQSFNY